MKRKEKYLKAGIAITIALILSVGATMARQIQGSSVEQSNALESQAQEYPQNEDPRDVMCPMISDASPLIFNMIQQGDYDLGKDGDDPPPEEVERRLTHLNEEWCPFNIPGDWGAGDFDFHFLTALGICAAGMLGLAGIPYYIVSFVAVNILIGLSVYVIITLVLVEFGLDYYVEISNAYWHCVEILTGGV